MERNEPDNPGVIAHPPFIYLVALAVGLALHFAVPVRFLPAIWVQLAIGLPLIPNPPKEGVRTAEGGG